MKAIVYDRPAQWQLADLPDPCPAGGEVVIAVAACGVCGTDVHLDRGEFGPVYPLVPGHEIVGTISDIGEGVTQVKVGDRVALDNMTSCGTCRQCQRARPQFCHRMTALGVTDPGGFAQYVTAPAGKCHDLGDLDFDSAVFAEPLACVVHGLDVLRPPLGADVLVVGLGPTGLLMTQLLRMSGAGRVSVAGRQPAKLQLATDYGADHAVRLGDQGLAAAGELRALAPDGFDVIVDATGAEQVLADAAALLAIGGTLFVYGMTGENARLTLSPYDIFRRELTVRGSFSQAFSLGRAVGLLRQGRVSTDGMISGRYPLAAYAAALSSVPDGRSIKSIVTP